MQSDKHHFSLELHRTIILHSEATSTDNKRLEHIRKAGHDQPTLGQGYRHCLSCAQILPLQQRQYLRIFETHNIGKYKTDHKFGQRGFVVARKCHCCGCFKYCGAARPSTSRVVVRGERNFGCMTKEHCLQWCFDTKNLYSMHHID